MSSNAHQIGERFIELCEGDESTESILETLRQEFDLDDIGHVTDALIESGAIKETTPPQGNGEGK